MAPPLQFADEDDHDAHSSCPHSNPLFTHACRRIGHRRADPGEAEATEAGGPSPRRLHQEAVEPIEEVVAGHAGLASDAGRDNDEVGAGEGERDGQGLKRERERRRIFFFVEVEVERFCSREKKTG